MRAFIELRLVHAERHFSGDYPWKGVRGVSSWASEDRREVGFVCIDERSMELRQDGQKLRDCFFLLSRNGWRSHSRLNSLTMGENDCRARWGCGFQFCMMVSEERDRKNDALLQDDLIDGDEFWLPLLIAAPLRPAIPHRISVLL